MGRNGQQSYCHTFLPPGFSSLLDANRGLDTGLKVVSQQEACEANELRRHIFANHIDSVQLKRLIRLLIVSDGNSHRRVVTLDPDQIAEQLDIKPESLATLVSYMQLRTDATPLITPLPSGPTVGPSSPSELPFFAIWKRIFKDYNLKIFVRGYFI